MAIHFDLVDLRLFVYIAEENSLTRAAVRAHMSLPAASIRIKNLEDSIGTKLINRDAQGITLRPPGQAFLRHARQVLSQLENLRGDMQEYAKGIKGHVRIFANTTAITEFLPTVLRSFLATHPDVNVDLREQLSHDIVRAVSEGITDIGIVAGSVRTEGLDVIPYRKDRLVLATALTHPLAQKSEISFADTLEYDYIGLHEGSAIHSFLNQAAGVLRKPLKIRIQVSSFEAVCRMIEANVGIGILPESAARRHAKNLSLNLIRLTDEWASRNLIICVRQLESLPVFARELIDLLSADSESGNTVDQESV
ncbi:MAG: LysR substrate-binding domain-containing protein [Noviherbaspirillum sp.]